MKYVIEVISNVILEIEGEYGDVGEAKAIEEACSKAWQYDADEMIVRVIERNLDAYELIALLDEQIKKDTDPERNALRQLLEEGRRKNRGLQY